jgi:nucleoid-associated protein YgaU
VAAIPKAAEAEAAAEAAPETQPAAPQAEPQAAPEVVPQAEPRMAPQVGAAPPSFDIVRIERSGEAVIAGRAAPGSEVTLRAGDRVLGTVTADGRGQWVLVLETPLAPGSYELSLESRLPGGEMVLSENVVVVSVPQPQVAATEPEAPSQPVVAAPPETMAQEAPVQPTPAQPTPAQPTPEQQAAEPSAPSQPAPAEATGEAAGAAQATQTAQSTQDTQAAQPVAPSAQVAAAEPAAEVQAPAQPAVQAEPDTLAPASQVATAPAPQVATAPAPQVATETAPVAAPATEAEQPLAVLMPRSGEGRIRVLQQAESVSGGLGEGTLILETVDYDAEGRAQVGGRAEANSRLVVYLDNQPAAHAEATLSGHWEATLARSIAPGLHILRVDQLAGDGRVSARVETPFSRAAVLAALPSESAVIVQPGNSLWRISRRVYGEGLRFSVIYQANRDQIREPDLIYPGQIFVLPTTN